MVGRNSVAARRRTSPWVIAVEAATVVFALVGFAVLSAVGMGATTALAPETPSGVDSALLRAAAGAVVGVEKESPGCRLRSSVLLAIVTKEMGDATGRTIDTDLESATYGLVTRSIRGTDPAGPDTDAGAVDGDPASDRTVGPFRFVPAMWRALGRDASGDGVADPHNVFDAAASAAAHLCTAVPGDHMNPAILAEALRRYHGTGPAADAYASSVLAIVAAHDAVEASSVEALPGGLVAVGGITVAESLAPSLAAMLTHAATDGVRLTGGGYRSVARQVELRRAHCGNSHHAIYVVPASACRPPTARPGQSQHELGLAIDFDLHPGVYEWLTRHAPAYGLHQLPSERWHWSSTGR